MASLLLSHDRGISAEAIDNRQDRHNVLLDALNELRAALLKGGESGSVRAMLARVTELMRLHGENEDRLLALYDLPGWSGHRAEYQRLLGRMAQYDVRFEQRQAPAVYELVEYLRKWFTTCSGISGRKYGPWVQQCGMQSMPEPVESA